MQKIIIISLLSIYIYPMAISKTDNYNNIQLKLLKIDAEIVSLKAQITQVDTVFNDTKLSITQEIKKIAKADLMDLENKFTHLINKKKELKLLINELTKQRKLLKSDELFLEMNF